MAEQVYVIRNMCRAQSSRAQRATAVTQHRAALWVDNQKVLPKRPLKISVETFKRLESEIIKKLREGRLAFTTPEQYFVDSRPDGRIYVVRPGMQIVEEKEISSDHWRLLFEKPEAPASEPPHPLSEAIGTDQNVPGGQNMPFGDLPGLEGPAGMVGTDCGKQSLGATGPVGPSCDVGSTECGGGPSGPKMEDVVPPVQDELVVAEKTEEPVPTPTSEDVTKELPDPNAVLTLDTPTSTPVEEQQIKTKKRRR